MRLRYAIRNCFDDLVSGDGFVVSHPDFDPVLKQTIMFENARAKNIEEKVPTR